MCDYSLHDVASRPAKVGDELVTTQFITSVTRGFSAVGEPNVAVCLRPGTELAFKEDAKYDHLLGWLLPNRFGNIGEKVARFRQINMDQSNVHHDALEFANSKIVLLTLLRAVNARPYFNFPLRCAPSRSQGGKGILRRFGDTLSARNDWGVRGGRPVKA